MSASSRRAAIAAPGRTWPPNCDAASTSTTECPRRAATSAASIPAGPPPTTTIRRATGAGVSVPSPSSSSRPTAGFTVQVIGRTSTRFP